MQIDVLHIDAIPAHIYRSSPGPEFCELIQPSSPGRAAFSPQSHHTGAKPSVGSNSSITSQSKDRTFQWLSTASKGAKENSNVLLSLGTPVPPLESQTCSGPFRSLQDTMEFRKLLQHKPQQKLLGLKWTDILQKPFPEDA